MAHTYAAQDITLTAGADIDFGVVVKQFGLDDQKAGLAIPLTTAGEPAIGISSSAAKKGEAVAISFSGVAKVLFGATLTAGTQVTAGVGGAILAATPSTNILGTVVLGAQAGEIGSVLIDKNGVAVPTGN